MASALEIARHVGESTMLICRKSDALRPIRREPNGRLRGWLVARHEHRTGCNLADRFSEDSPDGRHLRPSLGSRSTLNF